MKFNTKLWKRSKKSFETQEKGSEVRLSTPEVEESRGLK
jgi:hypothetical protein